MGRNYIIMLKGNFLRELYNYVNGYILRYIVYIVSLQIGYYNI